jgi:hypothetical protein
MARASVARKEADDGAEDLARETLSLAARSRPSASEIVERVRQRADSSGNIARLDQAREDARSSAPPSRRSRPAGLAARTLRKAPLIGTVIVLTGMAAALALVVNRSGDDAPGTEQAATPAMQAPGVAPAAEVHAPSDNALTVDDLPQQAEPRAPAAGAPRAPAGAVARARPAAKPADAPKAEPAPLAQKTAPQEPAEDKSGPPPGMQRAEMPGGLPEKPSVGAVQAAMASVLGGARACVAGHSAPSSAVLVFGGLDGRVQSVTVQGPAAGTPSESCIRTALKQARVQPFALDTFTVRTTPIRP